MLGTQNQLRSEFEAELLAALNYPPSSAAVMYGRTGDRYRYDWVEHRWLGYLMGRAHDAKE